MLKGGDEVLYELLCHAEHRLVLCHTTDLRRIQPLAGTQTPPIYVVQFECPNDHMMSLNLCSAGHLDLINYSDPRLMLLTAQIKQELQELLLSRLEKYNLLTYEDFLKEVGDLDVSGD